ncbi:mannonate dehydratase [Hoeflea poritis]|uniref:Mannonate dehydratase n=1 Tax=Hoeflea poritis TaxID=2993659 RepID=A0ABT4VRZ4_9HYPH|nr:mannonate dehydratase [Hoeflea poritis]MDA4847480.1 mannonate dehydratase [Hoeflea poritis]
MRQTWRWFGPLDRVTIGDARQAGAEAIVSALHHIPPGALWPLEEIAARHHDVSHNADGTATGLAWEVVESLPVSEAIKTMSGDWRGDIERYKASLSNLAEAGIRTVCYNFMPVLDWTRTDLAAPMDHGGTSMRFDLVDFAVFDMHILCRPSADRDYPKTVAELAGRRFTDMSDAQKRRLTENVTAGLPGAAEHWTLEGLRDQLANYAAIDADRLRQMHIDFLSEIVPLAERLDIRLCCHPDDPPFPLLGLPRVMSTAEDFRMLLSAVDSPSAGLTFCSGSLGSRPDNDIPAMASEFAERIHFVHLRNVTRETEGISCSFLEDEHLAGDTDMVAVISALLAEEGRRRDAGRADHRIPMRPDHGQDILDDLQRGAQPGYPAIGRLKGLAELRGVMHALQSAQRSGSQNEATGSTAGRQEALHAAFDS